MSTQTVDIRSYTSQFYRGNRLALATVLGSDIVLSCAQILAAWVIQQLLDLMSGGSVFTLTELCLMVLGVAGMATLSEVLSCIAKPRFVTRGISQYKDYVFTKITKKNISAFSHENVSTYVSALTNDIAAIEQGYLRNLSTLVQSVLCCVGAFGMMLWYSPLFTLVALLLACVPISIAILTGSKLAPAEKHISDRNEVYTSTLKDALSGFSVVKSFKAEAQILRIFSDVLRELTQAQSRKERLSLLIKMCANLAGMVAQMGVFIFGVVLSLSGQNVSAGVVLAFVQLMNFVLGPIQQVPQCLGERKAARALIEKASTLLDANVREDAETAHRSLESGISVEHLHFGYEPEKTVLEDINYTFELGKKYALVGSSGSGKSTLLNLLMASYQDYEGRIAFDDADLRDISTSSLYETVSLIQQNVFIFNATIRDNITMFSDFPREEVDRAIELSGLSELVAERGDEYLCGENGNGLSGGEKQRIAIARTLLKRSQVLLVDEATAALDAQTAFQVSNAILDMDGLMRIVITHSLDESLLKRYDAILTMKNGSLVEVGTFDELMNERGYFYSLFTVSQ